MMGQLDVLHSSRHVVVAIDGATVAESSTPRIAFFNERVDLVVAIPGDDA